MSDEGISISGKTYRSQGHSPGVHRNIYKPYQKYNPEFLPVDIGRSSTM